MPIYEYECKACDSRFEKLVRSAAAASNKIECPECGSTKTTRAISVFAVSGEGSKKTAEVQMPMCGRCGGPGPCGMG